MNKYAAHAPHGAELRTLLYVEDDTESLTLVEKIISRRPELRLLTAINGNSGIRIARASLPEVIVMDINLPDISGFKVMEILRSDPATAHIHIIALSANDMPLNIKSGMEAGFYRYLTKPIKVDEFMSVVDMALEFAKQNAIKRK